MTNKSTDYNITNVWTTLVMLGDNYACGAAVMAKSLRDTGTIYPIWCMVDHSVSDDCQLFLEEYFDRVVKIPLISYPVAPLKSKKQNEIYGSWIHASFTKWNILNPQVFNVDKVILVDADMYFLKNCDELFNLSAPAVTCSSPWSRLYSKNKKYTLWDAFGKLNHGDIVPNKSIINGLRSSFVGLSCMVLVSPNAVDWDTFNRILKTEKIYGNSHKKCISGYDEKILAETFLTSGRTVRHISQEFNWIVGKTDWLPNGVSPRSVQFYNGKPWREDPKKEGQWSDVIYWWQIAKTIIEEYPAASQWFYQI